MSSPNLLTDSISSLLWKIGGPASLGLIFQILFNITDAYWAGKLGISAAAAMSQTFPLFLLMMVANIGLSSASSTLIGNALGAKKGDYVRHIIQHVCFLSILFVIVLTPLLLAGLNPLLALTGDLDPTVQALSRAYIVPIIACAFAFFLSNSAYGILIGYGDTKVYRNSHFFGALLNLILDPLLMFGIPGVWDGMGIAGVAWATVIIQCGIASAMLLALRRHGVWQVIWSRWQLHKKIFLEMFSLALPASIGMISVSVGIFIINAYLRDFGTTVMAVYGVGTRIEQLILLPVMGISLAASTIIAHNNGAGDFSRVRQTYIMALKIASWSIIPFVVLIWLFSDFLYSTFIAISGGVSDVLDVGHTYTQMIVGLFWGYIILSITMSALQSIKRPMFGLWMGLTRQIILPLIVFTLVLRGGGDYLSLWWGIFGIVWASALVTAVYGWTVFRDLGK